MFRMEVSLFSAKARPQHDDPFSFKIHYLPNRETEAITEDVYHRAVRRHLRQVLPPIVGRVEHSIQAPMLGQLGPCSAQGPWGCRETSVSIVPVRFLLSFHVPVLFLYASARFQVTFDTGTLKLFLIGHRLSGLRHVQGSGGQKSGSCRDITTERVGFSNKPAATLYMSPVAVTG